MAVLELQIAQHLLSITEGQVVLRILAGLLTTCDETLQAFDGAVIRLKLGGFWHTCASLTHRAVDSLQGLFFDLAGHIAQHEGVPDDAANCANTTTQSHADSKVANRVLQIVFHERMSIHGADDGSFCSHCISDVIRHSTAAHSPHELLVLSSASSTLLEQGLHLSHLSSLASLCEPVDSLAAIAQEVDTLDSSSARQQCTSHK